MRFILFIALVFFIGCAPGLSGSLEVPRIDLGEGTVREFRGQMVSVKLADFIDARVNPEIVLIDGRKVSPEGSIAEAVSEALSGLLQEALVKVSSISPRTLTGEILDWSAVVTPSFPLTKVEADARVLLVVKNAAGRITYRGVYSSQSVKEHPAVGESGIQDVLSDAMASALREALRDTDFRASLLDEQSFQR